MKSTFFTGAPACRVARASTRRGTTSGRPVRVQSLFGFGKDPAKEAAKEAEFQEQQRILEARRAGKALDSSRERRSKVSEYIQEEKAAKKKAWREGKNVKLPGRKSGIEAVREQYGMSPDGKEDENKGRVGFVLPLNSIGMPKYDQGSRFDLEAPYADEGYVDEDDKGGFSLGRIFGMGKKDKKDDK